jgi:hypothetical protein
MRDIWYCKFCLHQSYIEHDGVNGHCVGCGTPVVKRRLSGDIFNTAWFPLAEAVVGWESPIAGAALKSLEKVDETAAPDSQPLLNLAAVVIIASVGALILKEVLTSTRS